MMGPYGLRRKNVIFIFFSLAASFLARAEVRTSPITTYYLEHLMYLLGGMEMREIEKI